MSGTRAVAPVMLVLMACFLSGPVRASPSSIEVELGVREFSGEDDITIVRVLSSDGKLRPGSVVTVEGTYRLETRDRATLYLGTTVRNAARAKGSPEERREVTRGTGSFELRHRIPAEGYLHLTIYDVASGRPFGGVYFGMGEGVLRARLWPYER